MERKLKFRLLDTKTGVQKDYVDITPYDEDGAGCLYQWGEGNYSCDCNRSLFLYDHAEDKEYPCNIGKSVIVVKEVWDANTGELIFEDGVVQNWP